MSYSENEDDPAVYESSGDEWDESMEVEKKRNKRRTSQRLSKKPKITHVVSSESSADDDDDDYDEDEDDDDDEIVHKSNGVNKKAKKSPPKPAVVNKQSSTPTTPVSKPANTTSHNSNFSTGTFVILKKDAQEGSESSPPCIWKIDGKALLQKYEPFEEDGKVKHRNTSIYTGWSSLDKDQYSSIQVQVIVHSGQKMIVELNWDQLKTITVDSD